MRPLEHNSNQQKVVLNCSGQFSVVLLKTFSLVLKKAKKCSAFSPMMKNLARLCYNHDYCVPSALQSMMGKST